MKLQRQYSADGKCCTHVVVHHTGTSPEQNFSDRLVDAAVREGWIVISGEQLQVKTDGEPLRYQLLRRPGYYCKSSGEPIPVGLEAWLRFRLANDSTGSRAEALAWLAAHGKAADDYDITTAYHGVLDAAQHARHRAVSEGGIVRAAALDAGV